MNLSLMDEKEKQKVIDGTYSISSNAKMNQDVPELERRNTII